MLNKILKRVRTSPFKVISDGRVVSFGSLLVQPDSNGVWINMVSVPLKKLEKQMIVALVQQRVRRGD